MGQIGEQENSFCRASSRSGAESPVRPGCANREVGMSNRLHFAFGPRGGTFAATHGRDAFSARLRRRPALFCPDCLRGGLSSPSPCATHSGRYRGAVRAFVWLQRGGRTPAMYPYRYAARQDRSPACRTLCNRFFRVTRERMLKMKTMIRRGWDYVCRHAWFVWHLPEIIRLMGTDDREAGNTLT